jgi:hypothetical protein
MYRLSRAYPTYKQGSAGLQPGCVSHETSGVSNPRNRARIYTCRILSLTHIFAALLSSAHLNASRSLIGSVECRSAMWSGGISKLEKRCIILPIDDND